MPTTKIDSNDPRPARYHTMESTLRNFLNEMAILAGDKVGPSGSAWQDVAATAAVNAHVLFQQLTEARAGNAEAGLVFPSPLECMEVEKLI